MWSLIEKELDWWLYILSNHYVLLVVVATLSAPLWIKYIRKLYPKKSQDQIALTKELELQKQSILSTIHHTKFSNLLLTILFILFFVFILLTTYFLFENTQEYLLVSYLWLIIAPTFIISLYFPLIIISMIEPYFIQSQLSIENYQKYLEIDKLQLEALGMEPQSKTEKLIAMWFLPIFLLLILYMAFPVKSYTVFNQDSMRIVELKKFTFSTQPYTNIQSIKKIPKKEHIAITFKDGSTWKSTDYSNRELFNSQNYKKLKEFLEDKTNLILFQKGKT